MSYILTNAWGKSQLPQRIWAVETADDLAQLLQTETFIFGDEVYNPVTRETFTYSFHNWTDNYSTEVSEAEMIDRWDNLPK